MVKAKKPQCGELLPRYRFVLNPYPDVRVSRCPGTVEKATWREGLQPPKAIAEMLSHASDFAEYYNELRVTRPGWYKADQEPPVMEPPPSREWVKLNLKPIGDDHR